MSAKKKNITIAPLSIDDEAKPKPKRRRPKPEPHARITDIKKVLQKINYPILKTLKIKMTKIPPPLCEVPYKPTCPKPKPGELAKLQEQCTELSKTIKKTSLNLQCHTGMPKLDPDTAACLESKAFELFTEVLQQNRSEELMFSFNGGKDCTVVLHMLCKYFNQPPLRHIRIPVLYVEPDDAFTEVEQFVQDCEDRYSILVYRKKGCIKKVLTDFCSQYPHLKAVVMGCRRSDPYCANLQCFQLTDPGWPELLRVNPILDWTCWDIWNYMLVNKVPYCSLYDQGYTSLGSKSNTLPNPYLMRTDPNTGEVIYRPAYELTDDKYERLGRIAKVAAVVEVKKPPQNCSPQTEKPEPQTEKPEPAPKSPTAEKKKKKHKNKKK